MASFTTSEARLYPWLHLRSLRVKTRRPQWRSDWQAVWIVLLLMTMLGLFSFIIPANETLERVEQQATQNATVSQQGVLSAAVERAD